MNNSDIQRIFLEIKAKSPEHKEKASEELKSIFKKNPEISEEVEFLNKYLLKNIFLNRSSPNCKGLSIVVTQMKN